MGANIVFYLIAGFLLSLLCVGFTILLCVALGTSLRRDRSLRIFMGIWHNLSSIITWLTGLTNIISLFLSPILRGRLPRLLKMYDTVEEARMRLTGTIVFFRGEPRYVRECVAGAGGDVILQLDTLPDLRNGITASIRDPELNMREYRQSVGYMNNVTVDGGATYNAHYVMRMPIRGDGYKQGLHQSNLIFPRIHGERMRWQSAISGAPFKDMLTGVYPTIEQAKELLENRPEQRSVAFSRVFAISRDPELGFYILHYKGRRVAHGELEHLILPSHNYYLSEVLADSGVRVQ